MLTKPNNKTDVDREVDEKKVGLVNPIISLFSVAAFIIVLGTIRSLYNKPKRSELDKRTKAVARNTEMKRRREVELINSDNNLQDHQYLEIRNETPLLKIIPAAENQESKRHRSILKHKKESQRSDNENDITRVEFAGINKQWGEGAGREAQAV